jgi:hypothetical protein
MRVWALPEVIEELEDLIDILYEKGYFSYEETSANYVVELFEDIINNLPKKIKRLAPKHFTDLYGEGLYYAVFQKNKRTQWYAFFRMYKNDEKLYYQVRHIENNHTAAQYFDFGYFN